MGKLKDAKMDLAERRTRTRPRSSRRRTKVATATVTDVERHQTLEVRKDKDKNYYAKSSRGGGVYKIASDLGDALDKGLDDFRNKKLFDFGFSDPTKVEVQGVTYTKSGDKWMSGAKTMDNTTVQTLIDKLRDLTRDQVRGQGRRRAGIRGHRDLE